MNWRTQISLFDSVDSFQEARIRFQLTISWSGRVYLRRVVWPLLDLLDRESEEKLVGELVDFFDQYLYISPLEKVQITTDIFQTTRQFLERCEAL